MTWLPIAAKRREQASQRRLQKAALGLFLTAGTTGVCFNTLDNLFPSYAFLLASNLLILYIGLELLAELIPATEAMHNKRMLLSRVLAYFVIIASSLYALGVVMWLVNNTKVTLV